MKSVVVGTAGHIDHGKSALVRALTGTDPDRLKEEVFERFGSVEAKRETSRRGFGLGLYFVKIVMAAHGGSVSVRDRDGGGSVFSAFFPA